MKEPDYVMSLMIMYETTNLIEGTTTKRKFLDERGEQTVTFKYPEVVNNYYKYHHAVDDNNNIRMQPISIEYTWETKNWEHQPFVFSLEYHMQIHNKVLKFLGKMRKNLL